MGLGKLEHHPPEIRQIELGAREGHADHHTEQGQPDDHGGRVGESYDHRTGEKINDHPQAEKSEAEPQDTDHQGQHDGQLDEGVAAGRCEGDEGGRRT